jgi:hypothetical protein
VKPARALLPATLLAAILGLGACGRVTDLQPPPGKPLPVKPLMARTTPTAKELLTEPPYARPERVDEILKRSQPRALDPFDLPPPTGGSAPALPAGADDQPVSNDIGVTNPGS